MRKKREKAGSRNSSASAGNKRNRPSATDSSRGFKSTAVLPKPLSSQIIRHEPSSEDEQDVSSESEDDSSKLPTKTSTGDEKEERSNKDRTPLKSGTDVVADAANKKRYILFLGNLPHSATRDDIAEYFSKRGVPIADLRLLTDRESGMSKGYAFAEFINAKVMQNALKFHRSKLGGRTLNVEVTCGGGGKGDKRKQKIRERNRTMRRKRTVKSGKAIKSADTQGIFM